MSRHWGRGLAELAQGEEADFSVMIYFMEELSSVTNANELKAD
jgi:hypothetical protein